MCVNMAVGLGMARGDPSSRRTVRFRVCACAARRRGGDWVRESAVRVGIRMKGVCFTPAPSVRVCLVSRARECHLTFAPATVSLLPVSS